MAGWGGIRVAGCSLGKGRTVFLFSKGFRTRLWEPSNHLFNCFGGDLLLNKAAGS